MKDELGRMNQVNKEYHIAEVSDSNGAIAKDLLIQIVNDYLDDGWQLQGGHQVTCIYFLNKDGSRGFFWYYSQAIARESRQDKG